MFFWLIAIPFFVIIAMFTLFRLPSSDLNQPEEMQDAAMAFRMAMQHDAAAKLMQEYQGSSESDMFDRQRLPEVEQKKKLKICSRAEIIFRKAGKI